MAGVSKNGFDLIKATFAKLKGKFGKAFLATLIMIAPLMLCCFTVYGIAAAVILFAVFQVGYIRYMRALLNDENPSMYLIFSEFKEPWLEIFLGILLVSMYAVGYVLLIVPGIILVGLFSMSIFFAEYKKSKTPLEAMKYSIKYMKGNYSNMFAFKVLYWAVYFVILGLTAVGLVFVVKLWANYKVWSILLMIGLYILVTLAWSVVTMYYHVSSELFFRELLLYSDYRESKKSTKKVAIIEENTEVKEEKPVEQNVQPVEKKVVRKTAPKTNASKSTAVTTAKTAIKKSTAAKASSSTKSTAVKKTTTTKKTDK